MVSRSLEVGTRVRRRKSRHWLWLIFFLFLGSAAVSAWWAWQETERPNTEHVTPRYLLAPHAIMMDGEWTQSYAMGEGDGLLVPLHVGQKLGGDGIYYEQETDSVVLTTSTQVLHMKIGERDATMNHKPVSLQFAAHKEGETVYLPLAPLKELFGFQSAVNAETGIVTLYAPGQAVQPAEAVELPETSVAMRDGPSLQHPIVEELPAGQQLYIWGEADGWYRVQAASGLLGYVAKQHAILQPARTIPVPEEPEPFISWELTGKRINMTWEAVYNVQPDPKKIGELTGVNVVSPTWFELTDGEGTIRSKADAAYSQWYRDRGVQVWALFSNGFEPEQTQQALSSYETRLRMIEQLLAYAKTFKLQGINIDFENVKTSDKDNLVQFVREFTPLAHEHNLVVSIDVTPKSTTEFWSAFLDRPRLAQSVDYMMVMTYDEHWASSPVAGSVSSLPWVEHSLRRIILEDKVPPEKLVMGVPLYTREWTETPGEDGKVKVSSRAIGMGTVASLLAEKKLTPAFSEETNQHYVEYKEGDVTKKIWIEDAVSIEARMNLAKKYNLAGVATWARSFAGGDVWQVMDRHLQSRP